MKKYLALLSLILLSFSGWAQENFEKGYWIDSKSEKHQAWIKYDEQQVWVKANAETTARKLTADEFSAFYIGKLKYENFPQAEIKPQVLRVLVEGTANLYVADGEQPIFYFQWQEESIVKLNPETGKDLQNNYIHTLVSELEAENSQELFSSIVHVQYTEESLRNFIQDYNLLYYPEKAFTTYQAEKPLTHNVWVQAGLGYGKNYLNKWESVPEIVAGAFYELQLPVQRKHFSLRAGILYSQGRNPQNKVFLDAHNFQTYQLPLSIKYNFVPEGSVQPYIFAGLTPYFMHVEEYRYYQLNANDEVITDLSPVRHPRNTYFLKTYNFGLGMHTFIGQRAIKLEVAATPMAVSFQLGVNVYKYSKK